MDTIPLADLVQVLGMGRRSVRVGTVGRRVSGELLLQDGELVHASFGRQSGIDAVYTMLAEPGLSYKVGPLPPGEIRRTIHLPWQHIMLEAAMRHDHGVRDSGPLAMGTPPGVEVEPPPVKAPGRRGWVLAGLALAAAGAVALVTWWPGRGLVPTTLSSGSSVPAPVSRPVDRPLEAATAAPALPAGTTITVKGSDTIGAELGQAMARRFELDHPGTKVVWEALGSKTAFQGLFDGTADVGASSRAITQSEANEAQRLGLALTPTVFAHDGLSIIVHRTSKIDSVTLEQLSGIFQGTITDWQQLGGAPGHIHPYSRPSYSGTHGFFKEKALRMGVAGSTAEFSIGTRFRESNQEVVAAVAADPKGITYVGAGAVSAEVKVLALSPGESRPGVRPTPTAIRKATYPLSRDLYLYVRNPPSDKARALVAYVSSPAGLALVEQFSLVPAEPKVAAATVAATAPAASPTGNITRVPFESGQTGLTPRAMLALDALARQVRDTNARLLVVGHADAAGASQLNDDLAKRRAQRVATYLSALKIPAHRIEVSGDSADMPLASNRTSTGRSQNRRVDVHVLPAQPAATVSTRR